MSGSTTLSIRPSARRKLAVAAAVAVVLLAIGLTLAVHRGSPSSHVPHAATANASGSSGTTTPSQSPAGNATADAGQVGSEMIEAYVPRSPYLTAGPGTADASQVGSEMIGDYVPTTPQGGPLFGHGQR